MAFGIMSIRIIRKKWEKVTSEELKATIGLLILVGVYRGRLEHLEDLWSKEHGRSIFAAVMTMKRFKQILRYVRFDKATRPQRRATDKAAFRDVWEMFIAQLPKFYIPGTDITVDEQLVAYTVESVRSVNTSQVNQPNMA